jgi:peptidoglycan hydrolase CwlO-like protein
MTEKPVRPAKIHHGDTVVYIASAADAYMDAQDARLAEVEAERVGLCQEIDDLNGELAALRQQLEEARADVAQTQMGWESMESTLRAELTSANDRLAKLEEYRRRTAGAVWAERLLGRYLGTDEIATELGIEEAP